jgi:hypothetical protein
MSSRRGRPPAEIEIGAAARADRLRFRRKPRTRVEFDGEPAVESDSHTERRNLPEEVEPGKTYRDVSVRWTAGARIDDASVRDLEERIATRDDPKQADESKESR